jgi:hypothetical protein
VTLTPGGGRSPSTTTPPSPPDDKNEQPQPSRERRARPVRWRAAAISTLRWGVLIGGLVIIADLGTLAMMQRSFSPDDRAAIFQADVVLNWVLFSILGIIVVRETRLFYAGILAGVLGSVVDTAVVFAAQSMAAIGGADLSIVDFVVNSVLINTGFAAVSGIAYWLVQRSAGGTRPR